MCGIAGFVGNNQIKIHELSKIFELVLKSLHNRGPDNKGTWHDATDNNVFLGHTRLSIIDTSSNGSQPMVSRSGRYIIVYNGECYNHLKLRSECEDFITQNNIDNHKWVGHSDTETILLLIEIYGFSKAIAKIEGMFAIAVWDRKKNNLLCARDRFGEKPFYYYYDNQSFIFGSDSRIFSQFPSFKKEIDRNSLSYFLAHGYISKNFSIYKNVYQISPGTILIFNPKENIIKKDTYFDIDKNLNSKNLKFFNTFEESCNQLNSKLTKVVENEMMSDVRIGSFLSGGIDSSLITAIMQKVSAKKIDTFSVSFDNPKFDESVHAQAVSDHLQTNHHNVAFKEKDALDILCKIPDIYSEPFADTSILPTIFLSNLASKDIKVALTGDGGDEFFCGYNRYEFVQKYWKYIKIIPPFLRSNFSSDLNSDKIFFLTSLLKSILSSTLRSQNIPELELKINRALKTLRSTNVDELYYNLTTIWDETDVILNNKGNISVNEDSYNLNIKTNVEKIMYKDMNYYLPENILVKLDRASMYYSLEARAPFLHPEIFDISCRIPFEYKYKNGSKKYILKKILKNYIPGSITERPKQGFSIPIKNWMSGQMRDWAEDLLSEKKLNNIEYINTNNIKKTWNYFLEDKGNFELHIWNILMLSNWYNYEKN